MTHYGMAIDVKRCIACSACVTGCKVENNLPQNMWWNKVVNVGGETPDSPSGTYAARDLKMESYTLSCQHCENPACVEVCPTQASYKDAETGIVLVDNSKCIGCGICQQACPYGVRVLQEGEPVYYADFGFGAATPRCTRRAPWRSAPSATTAWWRATCPSAWRCAPAAPAPSAIWTTPLPTSRSLSPVARWSSWKPTPAPTPACFC